MTADPRSRATLLLAGASEGEGMTAASAEELMPLVYDELREVARRFMGRESPANTLQPTALVHEAYLRLVDQSRVSWQGRTHFRAVGAIVMRRILVDRARSRRRQRRGGHWHRVTLTEALLPGVDHGLDPEQLLSLETALDALASRDPRQSRVVELRVFGGLTVPEVAQVLGVSTTTVEGDWRHARAWLRRGLSQ